MHVADFCVVAKRSQQVVKVWKGTVGGNHQSGCDLRGKVRRGYSDGGVIPTVALISPAYCGVSQ